MIKFIDILMEVIEDMAKDFEIKYKPLIEAKFYLDTIFMLEEYYNNTPKLLTFNKI